MNTIAPSPSYAGIWERLADALQRIITATGRSKEDAERDICHALADGAVKFRCRLERHETKRMTSRSVLPGDAFEVPAVINPDKVDWENSRPKRPWLIRRGAYSLPGYWRLDWLEVFKVDITEVLCGPQQPSNDLRKTISDEFPAKIRKAGAAAIPTSAERRRGPRPAKFEATKEAMRQEIWAGSLSFDELASMREKTLEAKYGVSRDTARRARNAVLSEIKPRQSPPNDK